MEDARQFGEEQLDKDSGPSFFDVAAQETTKNLFHPALRRILQEVRQRLAPNNSYLLQIEASFDTVYLLLELLLESVSLARTGGSICEHYYGMRRTSLHANSNRTAPPLSRTQLLASLIEISIVPLLQRQLQVLLAGLRQSGAQLTATQVVVLKGTPALWTLYKLLNMLSRVHYLLRGKGPATILMAISKLCYQRTGLEQGAAAGILSLASLMYLLRFYEWWRQQQATHPIPSANIVPLSSGLPPPPKDFPQPVAGVVYRVGLCPLCKGPLADPAALPSGYLFCSNCIKHHLAENKTCPVSNIPVNIADIRPIFLE